VGNRPPARNPEAQFRRREFERAAIIHGRFWGWDAANSQHRNRRNLLLDHSRPRFSGRIQAMRQPWLASGPRVRKGQPPMSTRLRAICPTAPQVAFASGLRQRAYDGYAGRLSSARRGRGCKHAWCASRYRTSRRVSGGRKFPTAPTDRANARSAPSIRLAHLGR
jgi:hypothetical protein